MSQQAIQPDSGVRNGGRAPFDLRALMRLAVWGCLAAVATGLAVVAAYSGPGAQYLAASTASPPPPAAATDPTTKEETRRLTEAVRMLTADRDQLAMRVANLEHGLDDVTGSIKRAAAANPPPSPPAATATNTPAPPEAGATTPPPANDAATPAASDAESHLPTAVVEPAAALGVDVGGAVNIEGLRTLWASTRRSAAPLPDDLVPLIAVRENNKTRGVDLRLIVGPFPSTEAAARLCVALLAEHRYCHPVSFEGQRLSLAEPSPKSAHHVSSGP